MSKIIVGLLVLQSDHAKPLNPHHRRMFICISDNSRPQRSPQHISRDNSCATCQEDQLTYPPIEFKRRHKILRYNSPTSITLSCKPSPTNFVGIENAGSSSLGILAVLFAEFEDSSFARDLFPRSYINRITKRNPSWEQSVKRFSRVYPNRSSTPNRSTLLHQVLSLQQQTHQVD
jgi:hypothetical protein